MIELKRYVEKECVFITGKLIGGMAWNCVVKTGPKINVRKQSLCVLFLCIGHIYARVKYKPSYAELYFVY